MAIKGWEIVIPSPVDGGGIAVPGLEVAPQRELSNLDLFGILAARGDDIGQPLHPGMAFPVLMGVWDVDTLIGRIAPNNADSAEVAAVKDGILREVAALYSKPPVTLADFYEALVKVGL